MLIVSPNVALRCALLLAAAAWVATSGPPALAQLDESLATGTTSKVQRTAAAGLIPYNRLEPGMARQVSEVVQNASIYRQLPVTTVKCDPDMYLTLLRYPEIIIGTWQLMGVTQMDARRTGPFQLHATDGAGTTTRSELIYGDPHLNIYYAEGEYEGPMVFRKITGKCLIVVESRYTAGANGQPMVTSRMNVFLQFDNLAAGFIARTIHPLVGSTADHNFVETMRFAEKLSQTTLRNGPGVQRMAARLSGLSPEVRQRFVDVAGVVWQRSQPVQVQASPSPGMMQTGYTRQVSGYRGN